MPRERIDKVLVDRGLAASRERARAMIMAGQVLVDDAPVTKAGAAVDPGAAIRVRADANPFVSRGGLKLAGALDDLGLDVSGMVILDVGASTGGFTDCCLQRGAASVFAVDVGTNQLAYSLRCDSRVVCMEQTNARDLTPSMLSRPADLAVVDVSFISITKVLEPVLRCLCSDGRLLAMVKPQFEVGRERVGKGGVVRNDDDRSAAVDIVVEAAASLGLEQHGQVESRVHGPKGNREIFVLLGRPTRAGGGGRHEG